MTYLIKLQQPHSSNSSQYTQKCMGESSQPASTPAAALSHCLHKGPLVTQPVSSPRAKTFFQNQFIACPCLPLLLVLRLSHRDSLMCHSEPLCVHANCCASTQGVMTCTMRNLVFFLLPCFHVEAPQRQLKPRAPRGAYLSGSGVNWRLETHQKGAWKKRNTADEIQLCYRLVSCQTSWLQIGLISKEKNHAQKSCLFTTLPISLTFIFLPSETETLGLLPLLLPSFPSSDLFLFALNVLNTLKIKLYIYLQSYTHILHSISSGYDSSMLHKLPSLDFSSSIILFATVQGAAVRGRKPRALLLAHRLIKVRKRVASTCCLLTLPPRHSNLPHQNKQVPKQPAELLNAETDEAAGVVKYNPCFQAQASGHGPPRHGRRVSKEQGKLR